MKLNYTGKIFFGINLVESYKYVASKLKIINWKNFKATALYLEVEDDEDEDELFARRLRSRPCDLLLFLPRDLDRDFLREFEFLSDFLSGTIFTTDLKILFAISGSISSSDSLLRRRPRDRDRETRRLGDRELKRNNRC